MMKQTHKTMTLEEAEELLAGADPESGAIAVLIAYMQGRIAKSEALTLVEAESDMSFDKTLRRVESFADAATAFCKAKPGMPLPVT